MEINIKVWVAIEKITFPTGALYTNGEIIEDGSGRRVKDGTWAVTVCFGQIDAFCESKKDVASVFRLVKRAVNHSDL